VNFVGTLYIISYVKADGDMGVIGGFFSTKLVAAISIDTSPTWMSTEIAYLMTFPLPVVQPVSYQNQRSQLMVPWGDYI